MKILESSPNRYDRGIRMLTLGRLYNAYDRLTVHIQEGQRVLDNGCGTGALTIRAAQKKTTVKGIDINAVKCANHHDFPPPVGRGVVLRSRVFILELATRFNR